MSSGGVTFSGHRAAARGLGDPFRQALIMAGLLPLFLAGARPLAGQETAAGFSFELVARQRLEDQRILAVYTGFAGRHVLVISKGYLLVLEEVTAEGALPVLVQRFGRTFRQHEITAAAVAPGGTAVAVASADGRIAMVRLPGLDVAAQIAKTGVSEVSALSFVADGAYVAVGGRRGAVALLTPSGERFATLEIGQGEAGDVAALFPGPLPRSLLALTTNRSLHLYDVDTQTELRSSPLDFEVKASHLEPSKKVLALGLERISAYRFRGANPRDPGRATAEDRIRLIDSGTGLPVRELWGEDQQIRALALSPDGRFLASGGAASRATVWDTQSGAPINRIALAAPLAALDFSPDGQRLATVDRAGELSLFSLRGVSGLEPKAPARPLILIILEPETVLSSRGEPLAALVTAPSALVRGQVRSSSPLRSVMVDGREVTSIAQEEDGSYRFTAFVSLANPGQRQIELLAENQAGERATKALLLERVGDEPARADAAVARRLALLIGISRYRDPGIQLDFADRDAQELHRFLTAPERGPARFETQNVKLLLNEDAHATAINTGLRDFLQGARENDFVIFFFAGHGVPDPRRTQDLYLLAHDSDPANVAGTGLLMQHVREAISQIRARHVLVLTDACHSAGMAAPEGIRSLRVNPIHETFLARLQHSSSGMAILTASEAAQESLESERWKSHGVFTHFLLQGLEGRADANTDGIVNLGELMEFVREKVKNETGARQIPAIGPTLFDRELPLAIVGSASPAP